MLAHLSKTFSQNQKLGISLTAAAMFSMQLFAEDLSSFAFNAREAPAKITQRDVEFNFEILKTQTKNSIIYEFNIPDSKHHQLHERGRVEILAKAAKRFAEIKIPRSLNTVSFEDWPIFLTPRDPCIKELAHILSEHLDSKEEKAQRLLDFVYQAITYQRDYHDKLAFPTELLYREKGACADFSMLYASLCIAAGVDVHLLIWPDIPKLKSGHALCVVPGNFNGWHYLDDNKQKFYIADPSAGYQIGSSAPPDFSQNADKSWKGAMIDFNRSSKCDLATNETTARVLRIFIDQPQPIFNAKLWRQPFRDEIIEKK